MKTKKQLRLGEGGAARYRTRSDLFESLPDDIVIIILCKLTSSASSPSEFVSVLATCKRLKQLGVHPLVLSNAGHGILAISAKNWSDEAHRFLKLCVNAGNKEAHYTLGMIRFYCLQNRGSGASLMAKAAIKSHAPALYSLALIQFNGSGGMKTEKNLRAAVVLCARAAYLGHVDALRELGHCLQDGYGVRKDVEEGSRLLLQANAFEFASDLRAFNIPSTAAPSSAEQPDLTESTGSGLRFLNEYQSKLTEKKLHPANRFLIEWFGLREGGVPGPGMRMCADRWCGRPETRRNEFRRCSGCGKVNYCSRGCQARDWWVHHKVKCAPMVWNRAIHGVEEEEEVVDDRTVEMEEIEIIEPL